MTNKLSQQNFNSFNNKDNHTMLSKVGSNLLNTKYQSPFSIPDDAQVIFLNHICFLQIFRMKQKQKQRKREQKGKNQNLKIWEKGVKKTGITIRQLNQLNKNGNQQEDNQAKMSLIQAAKAAIKNRVKVNQPMHDFISKKRETLLFQMLIDHKRQKINEFEQMTRLHRKGLQRAEQMLQEDMQAFNSYLNDHKKQARDAIKKAETQTRKKNQKVAIIKEKLQIQADLTGKNMSKRQTLQNLKKYKNFLQSLSPDLSQQQRHKRQQKMQNQQNGQSFGVNSAMIPNNTNNNNINSNNLDDISQQDQDQDMYFKQPSQLIDIFHSLQQNNLFLITNLKQIQQETQQIKANFSKKRQTLTQKKTELLTNKTEMVKQIVQTDQELDQLKKTTNKDQISDYFSILQSQIIKLSRQNGLVNSEQKHLESLFLLKEIQRKIQVQLRYLKQVKQQKPVIIHNLQKACISEKRQKKKLKNEQQMQEKALKQKMQESPQREKRKGRPIMQRSIIKKQIKKQQIEVVQPQQQIQKRKYLT